MKYRIGIPSAIVRQTTTAGNRPLWIGFSISPSRLPTDQFCRAASPKLAVPHPGVQCPGAA
ncbi:hypothetical protein ADUPG1_005407, partial [Aduncisulcus paluster]